MIKKHDAVLHDHTRGIVIGIYTKGFLSGREITKENRVLRIQMANGDRKLIWEVNAKKL